MSRRSILPLLALGLFTASCSESDLATDYRYRLSVEVETPQGLRSGSSVIEVEQSMGRSAGTGFGKRINRRARGEAVSVDLSDGKTLFALLDSTTDTDWAKRIVHAVSPRVDGERFEAQLDDTLLIDGVVELPAWLTPTVAGKPRPGYPILAAFNDLDTPETMSLVDPEDLQSTFGDGVHLKRITVEITDDPVTTGIEQRLRWLTDPNIIENPGWSRIPLSTRKMIIGLRDGK